MLLTAANVSKYSGVSQTSGLLICYPQSANSTDITLFKSAVTTTGGLTTLPNPLTQTFGVGNTIIALILN